MPKGIIYAILGDVEDANRELQIAYNNRENFMVCLKWHGEYSYKELKQVPTYHTLLKEMNLE
jgi:hypothetical protein